MSVTESVTEQTTEMVPEHGTWIGVKCDVSAEELHKWASALKRLDATHGSGRVASFLDRCALVLRTGGVMDLKSSMRLLELERRAVEEIEGRRRDVNRAASVMMAKLYSDAVAEIKAEQIGDVEIETRGENKGKPIVVLTPDEVKRVEQELALGVERFSSSVMGALGLRGWEGGRAARYGVAPVDKEGSDGGNDGDGGKGDKRLSPNAGVSRRDQKAGVGKSRSGLGRGGTGDMRGQRGGTQRKSNRNSRIKVRTEKGKESIGISDRVIATVERGKPATTAITTRRRDEGYARTFEAWAGVRMREMGFTMSQIGGMMDMDTSTMWRHISGWTRHWKAQRLKGVVFKPESDWEGRLEKIVQGFLNKPGRAVTTRKGSGSVGGGVDPHINMAANLARGE